MHDEDNFGIYFSLSKWRLRFTSLSDAEGLSKLKVTVVNPNVSDYIFLLNGRTQSNTLKIKVSLPQHCFKSYSLPFYFTKWMIPRTHLHQNCTTPHNLKCLLQFTFATIYLMRIPRDTSNDHCTQKYLIVYGEKRSKCLDIKYQIHWVEYHFLLV